MKCNERFRYDFYIFLKSHKGTLYIVPAEYLSVGIRPILSSMIHGVRPLLKSLKLVQRIAMSGFDKIFLYF